jgi:hypothetical protein
MKRGDERGFERGFYKLKDVEMFLTWGMLECAVGTLVLVVHGD